MTEEKKMDYPETGESEIQPEAKDSDNQGAEADPLTLALQAIDALRAENAELKDKVLRTLADMDNLR